MVGPDAGISPGFDRSVIFMFTYSQANQSLGGNAPGFEQLLQMSHVVTIHVRHKAHLDQ